MNEELDYKDGYIFKYKERAIYRDFQKIPTYQEVICHSPKEFCVGYNGSGPAQAALAILIIHTHNNVEFAKKHYNDFKMEIIAKYPQAKDLVIRYDIIDDWIKNRRV